MLAILKKDERNVDVHDFVQETHSNKEKEIQWKREWGGRILLNFSHCIPNSCGTAILINNKANCIVLSTVSDTFGRFSISKVQVDDKVYLCIKKI